MKNNLLMLSFVALFILSCKKDLTSIAPENMTKEQQILLKESEDWYTKNAKKLSISEENKPINIGSPDWSKVALFKYLPDVPIFVVVPLTNYVVNKSYVKRMAPGGFRNLLIRKYKKDHFVVDIIEFHPDEAYLEKKRKEKESSTTDPRLLVSNEDFTGYFLVYNSKNQLRHGERRENGKIISVFKH